MRLGRGRTPFYLTYNDVFNNNALSSREDFSHQRELHKGLLKAYAYLSLQEKVTY
jgi:hypothetical protein